MRPTAPSHLNKNNPHPKLGNLQFQSFTIEKEKQLKRSQIVDVSGFGYNIFLDSQM